MSMATGASSGLKGTGYKQFQTGRLDSDQQNLFKMLMGGSQEGLSAGLSHLTGLAKGDPSQFEQMEAPALREFAGRQGNIASRFSGMGSGGRRSSGFKSTMNEASMDLAERLQSNRLNMQNDAIRQLMGLGDSLLNRQTFETSLIPKKQSALMQLLASLGGGVSQGFGSGVGKAFGGLF